MSEYGFTKQALTKKQPDIHFVQGFRGVRLQEVQFVTYSAQKPFDSILIIFKHSRWLPKEKRYDSFMVLVDDDAIKFMQAWHSWCKNKYGS